MVTWITALARTRDRIAGAVNRILSRGRTVTAETLEELEESLLAADVPARMAADVIADFAKAYRGLDVDPRAMLAECLVRALGEPRSFSWTGGAAPLSVLVVGINGSGKTTTCAKLAGLAKREGRSPLLGAADTFRAAGSDQLRIWAGRVGVDVVAGQTGSDAAAVAYDALDAALARGSDVVLVDTAGRMHTKQPLMEELAKVKRAMGKRLAGAPHETWIVLDASMGQNALAQARMFHDATGLTGAVIAKLDGSAKAGFVFAVHKELGVPVLYVGLGEGAEDLAPFAPREFVHALLGLESNYKETGDVPARAG